jgi:hypothetical protein
LIKVDLLSKSVVEFPKSFNILKTNVPIKTNSKMLKKIKDISSFSLSCINITRKPIKDAKFAKK